MTEKAENKEVDSKVKEIVGTIAGIEEVENYFVVLFLEDGTAPVAVHANLPQLGIVANNANALFIENSERVMKNIQEREKKLFEQEKNNG